MEIDISPLALEHERDQFNCGHDPITSFCQHRALTEHQEYDVRVFVAVEPNLKRVLGFYSLTMRHIKGGGRVAQMPAIYLAMIGVCGGWQRQQIGTRLMNDAFERCVRVSEDVGAHFLWLTAINDKTRDYYRSLGFSPFRENDMRMRIHLQTLRASEP